MGASLDFHLQGQTSDISPAIYVTTVYEAFGFHFDHIYGYELKPKDPKQVYQQIPDTLKAAYHWYNVGVDADISSSNNPLKLLLEHYTPDDFIVVKLDIDTGSIEQPMIEYIRDTPAIQQLIDVIYFEHHVHSLENAVYWKTSMRGTVQDSLQLFQTLRQKGIAAHYWP